MTRDKLAALPTEAPEPVALHNDPGRPVSMGFADGTVVYLTIEQGRRALAASLEAVNIPSTIDGAIKAMRVLRTMLDKEKLAGVEVADEIIAGLRALGRDPNARPATVSSAVPVATDADTLRTLVPGFRLDWSGLRNRFDDIASHLGTLTTYEARSAYLDELARNFEDAVTEALKRSAANG